MATTLSENLYNQISIRIIKEQELIIGPVAWEEAKKVPGLTVNEGKVSMQGDVREVLNKLVSQYAKLFGQASTEACKEAVQDLLVELPKDQVPQSLQ